MNERSWAERVAEQVRAARVELARILVALACSLIEGHDDRVVFLNTERRRNRAGPKAGRIPAFMESEKGEVIAWPAEDAEGWPGTPVPIQVAKLLGRETVDPRS